MDSILGSATHVERFVLTMMLVCITPRPAATAPDSWLITDGIMLASGDAQVSGSLVWGSRGLDGMSPVVIVHLGATGSVLWNRQIDVTAGVFSPTGMMVEDDGDALLFAASRELASSPLRAALVKASLTGVLTTLAFGPAAATPFRDAWLTAGAGTGGSAVTAVGTIGLAPTNGWLVDLDDITPTASWRIGDPDGVLRHDLRVVRVTSSGVVYVGGGHERTELRHIGINPWVLRLAPDRTIVWQKTYEIGLPSEIVAMAIAPSGDVVLVGTAAVGPSALWLLIVDPTGRPTVSTLYTATATIRVSDVSVTSDGNILVALRHEPDAGGSEPGLVQLDASGNVLWSRTFDHGAAAQFTSVWSRTDGSLWCAGLSAAQVLVMVLDPSGEASTCATVRDLPLSVEDIPAASITTNAVAEVVTVQSWPSPALDITSPSIVDASCDCPQRPDLVRNLRAVHASSDDLYLRWDSEPAANGYNVWKVRQKQDIDRARQSGAPLANGVAGCSAPIPTVPAECTEIGAINRPSREVVYYQVRATCGSQYEGP